jgi:putative ABC transport system permease protein
MLRDLRHAVHTLSRSPGYAALCIAVLALGIGANAAIFSVLDSVVLHALPYPDPDRLVYVWERFPALPPPVGPRMKVRRVNFQEWRRQATVFSSMAAFNARSMDESSSGHPKHVDVGFTSATLFPMLGAQARIGRLFGAKTNTLKPIGWLS